MFSIDTLMSTYCIFVENNIDKAKSYYYEAALANAYVYERIRPDIFNVMADILLPILSDNEGLIKRYLGYSPAPEMEKAERIFVYLTKAVQNVEVEDIESLEIQIDEISRRSKSPLGKHFIDTIDIFNGFLEKNEHKIFLGINAFQKKMQRHQIGLMKDYMGVEATGLAKLAWRKGFEIDFKNKFIPQALLPIKELEHYESFDFFKEPE